MSAEPFGNLSGLRAVVTGSSSGIGRAIALELARGGADVVVHSRRSTSGSSETASAIRELGRRVVELRTDLSEVRSLESFVDRAWQCLDGPIDIWVNNAGADLLTGEEARLDYAQKLQRLLDVDVRSVVLLSREVGNRMASVPEGNGGAILNIGWDQADRGMEGVSGELFAASKNAVMGFTRSLSVSLAPRVRVNCLAPGWIRTAWGESAGQYWQDRVQTETPLKRWGTPEDVAKAARFLASPDASFITGQVIRINGGAVR